MKFQPDQKIKVKLGSPIYTILYAGKGKKELATIGKTMEKEREGIAVYEVGTQSTAYDEEHTHVRLADGNFWIIANEDIEPMGEDNVVD